MHQTTVSVIIVALNCVKSDVAESLSEVASRVLDIANQVPSGPHIDSQDPDPVLGGSDRHVFFESTPMGTQLIPPQGMTIRTLFRRR